jgi:hypothetical protein
LDGVSRTVVWDVDDVLNDLMRSWLENVWIPAHPTQVVRYEDVTENPPHALLGIGFDEYLSSLDEFRLSSDYAQQAPNPDILAWLQKEGGRCRHIALTATPLRTAPTAAEWVLRHFGRWIREFAFIPARREGENLPTYDADKGAWLARLGTSAVLVDDSPQNVAAATEAGAVALRWPRPWNGSRASVSETLQALTRLIDAREAP